jgi:predicted O-linked N-acetylglucosamine transferase (SPINDLY family)
VEGVSLADWSQLAAQHMKAAGWGEARECLQRALADNPQDAQAWNRLGLVCKELGELEEAARCFARTAELAPRSAGALCNAASAQRDLGRVDDALALLRRARAMAPDNLDVLSAYLFTLNLTTSVSREEIFREHLETERILGGKEKPWGERRSREKLKIAYLSPDLRFHAVACFVEPLLRHHDRGAFEVSCYYLYPSHDAVSRQLAGLADRWTDCAKWPGEQLARRIEADGIDILVDLAGHTDWNALPALALKPAPVIATWLGYLNTSGLRAVDFRITDRHTDPPGATERFHTEKLARLPESQWCRQPPASEPAVARLPDGLRLGSFNKGAKITAEVVELWAAALRALPAARLLLAGIEPGQRARIAQLFAGHGVGEARLEFAARVPLEQFRRLHDGVHFALDAYPYSGATTTLDSLWMGVPTLTLAGEAPMSRSSASLLATLGMEDWICRSKEAFVAAAMRHASDSKGLAGLRASLRPSLESSILMDGPRFARQLEELYRRMWRG